MKLKAGQIKSLASQISKNYKGFLIYGTDVGTIQETARNILRLLGAQVSVTDITADRLKETPTLFWDEVTAISMFGDRHVIRFKNPSDTFAKEIDAFLTQDTGDTFVLMTADNLNTKSALVKACDAAEAIGCIGCYPQEEQDIRQTIQQILSENGYLIAPDALAFLSTSLGSDKGVTLSEIDKLMLYMGTEKQVTLAHAEASIGNGSAVSIDDLIMSALSGKPASVQKNYQLLLQEGTQPVAITRSFISKLNQLILVLSKIKKGEAVDSAIRATPPFIPFKYNNLWKKIVLSWPENSAYEALFIMLDAEKNCKTGLPAELICNRALTSLTQAGKKFLNLR